VETGEKKARCDISNRKRNPLSNGRPKKITKCFNKKSEKKFYFLLAGSRGPKRQRRKNRTKTGRIKTLYCGEKHSGGIKAGKEGNGITLTVLILSKKYKKTQSRSGAGKKRGGKEAPRLLNPIAKPARKGKSTGYLRQKPPKAFHIQIWEEWILDGYIFARKNEGYFVIKRSSYLKAHPRGQEKKKYVGSPSKKNLIIRHQVVVGGGKDVLETKAGSTGKRPLDLGLDRDRTEAQSQFCGKPLQGFGKEK